MQRVKDKIAKLMALSESGNEFEAESALKKAIALMQKHQIEQGDIHKAEVITETKQHTHVKLNVNYTKLMLGIARQNGVFFVYVNGSYGRKAKFILTGNAADIEVTWYFYETARAQIDAKTNIWKRENRQGAKAGNQYRQGLVIGYTQRFKKMMSVVTAEAKEAGTGLIPVDTRLDDAETFYRAKGKKLKNDNRTAIYNRAGIADSADLKINKGINGAKAPLAIGRKF